MAKRKNLKLHYIYFSSLNIMVKNKKRRGGAKQRRTQKQQWRQGRQGWQEVQKEQQKLQHKKTQQQKTQKRAQKKTLKEWERQEAEEAREQELEERRFARELHHLTQTGSRRRNTYRYDRDDEEENDTRVARWMAQRQKKIKEKEQEKADFIRSIPKWAVERWGRQLPRHLAYQHLK